MEAAEKEDREKEREKERRGGDNYKCALNILIGFGNIFVVASWECFVSFFFHHASAIFH